jgi:flagellar protein FlaF
MASNNHLKAYQKTGASQGYANTPQPGSPTYTEAWALIEAARRLANCIERGMPSEIEGRRTLRDAIRLNWRLWTIFQSQLSVNDTMVPENIRVNMLSLCQFIDTHTIDTMANPTPEKIVTLIEMNRNIASGLLESFSETKEEPKTQPDQPPQPPSMDHNTSTDTKTDAISPPLNFDEEA